MAWHNVPMPGVYRFTPWPHAQTTYVSTVLAIVPPDSVHETYARRYEMTPAPFTGLRT